MENDKNTNEVIEKEVNELDSNVNNNDSNNKGKKIIGVIAIVAILALLSFLTFGKDLLDNRSDEDKLVDAYKKLYTANTVDMTYKMKISDYELPAIDDPQVQLVTNMIKDVNFDLNVKYNKDEHIFQGELDVNLQDTSLVNAYIYGDKELIGINIPFIHDKTFYVTWDSVISKLNEEIGLEINWKDYLELLNPDTYSTIDKINTEEYMNMYTDFMKELLGTVTTETVKINDDSVSCSKYPMELDYAKTFEFGMKVLDKMATDENVKAFVYEVIDKVVEKVIANEDYVVMNLTKEEIEESVNKFKDEYEELLSDLDGKTILEKISEMDGMQHKNLSKELFDQFDKMGITVKSNIYVDNKTNIRKVNVTEEIDNSEVGIKFGIEADMIVNSINKSIEFDGVDKEKAINVLELSEEEMQQIMTEIQANVLKQVMTNPIFSQMGGLMN
ncbi:MAG: hypothetical protein N4A50_08630 [Vallitalea sp.]|jgi:hypothetical protein|nr:hypothetical protein [Vallitalea sp.]